MAARVPQSLGARLYEEAEYLYTSAKRIATYSISVIFSVPVHIHPADAQVSDGKRCE